MAMVPQDEQTLQRLLGLETLPDDVLAEYELRAGMYHRSGETGPLGPLALIDLVRYLRRRPPEMKPDTKPTDWRSIDEGTAVECRFFGSWQPGIYKGFIANGMLGVKLNDDPMIRECRPDMVRLAEPALTFSDTVSQVIADAPSVLTQPTDHVDPDYFTPAHGETSAWKTAVAIDWGSYQSGGDVWVQTPDDVEEGKFLRKEADGQLTVDVGGKEWTVAANTVIPVNALATA